MKLNTETQGNVTTLSLEGNLLGEAYYQPMVELVREEVEAGRKHFVLDLTELKYVNSTGLGGMITMMTKARNAGGEVILIHIPDAMRKLLEMTKLDKIFVEAENLDAAMSKLQA